MRAAANFLLLFHKERLQLLSGIALPVCQFFGYHICHSKTYSMKRVKRPEVKVGIWVDTDNAMVVKMEGETEPIVQTVESGIESRVRFPGEGKRFARFGNTFVSDEERKERRLQQQLKKYYKRITSIISDADYLCIYGPGKRKQELQHYIENNMAFHGSLIECGNSGKVKTSLFEEKVKQFFLGKVFKVYRRNKMKEPGLSVA